jgi:hypothetical protein
MVRMSGAYGTVVTLGENQPNPVFHFQATSTLVTAADTHFILENGAKARKSSGLSALLLPPLARIGSLKSPF